MRPRSAALVAPVLAAALLTGCSGSDDPPTSLPTLSPSATASPTAAAVEVPAAARERTPQGADAFVRFFFAEMNAAFQTSDGDRIRRLTDGECETCENYARALDAARKDGELLQGKSFAIDGVAAPPLEASGVLVDVTGLVPERAIVDRFGKVVRKLPAAKRFKFEVAVKWDSAWLVSGIRLAQQQ